MTCIYHGHLPKSSFGNSRLDQSVASEYESKCLGWIRIVCRILFILKFIGAIAFLAARLTPIQMKSNITFINVNRYIGRKIILKTNKLDRDVRANFKIMQRIPAYLAQ